MLGETALIHRDFSLTDVAHHGGKNDETIPEVKSGDEVENTNEDINKCRYDTEEEVIQHIGNT